METTPMTAGADMKMEVRKLSDLIPADYNPREPLAPGDPEYEALKKSIQENTYVEPIVVNFDNTIIGGHQRRRVMMDLGYTDASVVVVNIQDKNKERMANLALNKITGRWDTEKLKEILVGLDLDGYDFTAAGFTRNELEDLIQSLDIPDEAQDDEFDPDAAAAEIQIPITNRGDVWQLGRHRLLCGDATESEDVAALMNGAELDLLVTDPPYNVNYGDKAVFLENYLGQTGPRATSEIKNDKMSSAAFYKFLRAAFRCAFDVMKKGAAAYIFHAESTGTKFREAFSDSGFKLAQCLVWEKSSFVLGRQDYQWRHEPILYGWKEGAGHYFIHDRSQDTILLEDEPDFKKMSKQELLAFVEGYVKQYKDLTTVLYEKRPSRNDMHPTMKPVPLVGRLVSNSSKPGWCVGDFFAGSGSTLMACEQLGRTAYLMELDERNCDVIVRRWEEYTGEKAVRTTLPEASQ